MPFLSGASGLREENTDTRDFVISSGSLLTGPLGYKQTVMFDSGTLTSLKFRRDYGVLRTYLPSDRRNLRMERLARGCGSDVIYLRSLSSALSDFRQNEELVL